MIRFAGLQIADGVRRVMPTFRVLPRFARDFAQLSEKDQERFREAVTKLVED